MPRFEKKVVTLFDDIHQRFRHICIFGDFDQFIDFSNAPLRLLNPDLRIIFTLPL